MGERYDGNCGYYSMDIMDLCILCKYLMNCTGDMMNYTRERINT
jgi:hypothetical protein